MSHRRDYEKLLRWYPREWRERYGDEFVALLEDTLEGARPSPLLRASIARAAAVERAHATGLIGPAATTERSRAGSLLVLCAWSLFALAGLGLAKFAEHWQSSTPPPSRALPAIAFGFVQGLGALTVIAVAVAGAATAPSIARLLRRGGWRRIRRHVFIAAAIDAATVVATAAIVTWAHRGSPHARVTAVSPHGVAVTLWAALIVASVAASTAAIASAVRRAALSPALVRLHARLATLVSVAIAAMTVATGLWWAAIAAHAPRFLDAARSGAPLQLVLPATAMLLATAVAAFGAIRAAAVLRA